MKNIDLVKNWILNSGIQNIEKEDKINGGFNGWFDPINKKYPFVYSEITGYGITTLLYMYEKTKNEKLLKRAKLATNWLKNIAFSNGGFKTRYFISKKSFKNNNIFIFDTGMILFGIINLYKTTKEQTYLDFSKKIGNFLISCQKSDGLFHAIFNSENKQFVNTKEKWSTQSGSYHAKIAMGMIELFEATKNEKYKKSAEYICDVALKFQKENGRFSTFNEKDETHLHPHCYSTEGLLYAGLKLKNEKYIKSSLKATKWALSQQLENGGIPFYFKEHPVQIERIDILAQTLRLGCILKNIGLLKNHDKKIKNLKNHLLKFQSENGGFIFGYDYTGEKKEHINSWCSMFAYQALDIYETLFIKKEDITNDLLII
jgi:rhamnogalacturonyl hydrolase YesR